MSLIPLPDQTIPEYEKTKEWHMDHINGYVGYSSSASYTDERKDIMKYYRAYNAELNEEELALTKSVTCPNGNDLGQEYIVYPLIQSKIEQIVGEFMRRPSRRKAYVMDKRSKAKKLEEKLKMVSEEIMRELTESMQGDLGFTPETEGQDMELPVDIEEFFEKDYKTIEEEVTDALLKYFLDVNKEKEKLRHLFTDYAICDRAHATVEKKDGNTTLRKIHPLDCDYSLDPYKVVQDNHEYFFENYYLTENEIYNSFTSLTQSQKDDVKATFSALGDSDGSNDTSDGWFRSSNKSYRMRVVVAKWKSRKRVSIKKSVSKNTGEVFNKKLPEDYKPRKRDNIEHIDGEMPRFCIMIGPDLCLDWGLMSERYSRVDSNWTCVLPIVSIVRDNTIGSSKIKSIAAKLYQLQSMASEILFEIRLAMKSAGDSRVLVYDAAQTPKDFVSREGFEGGLNRVLHHIKKDKLMIINSKEKGRDKNTFNQFTSLDLSSKGGLQDLFTGLGMIEDLASNFIGMSPEREGQVGQYQTATGTDKAIRGSSTRTEIIYTPFDDFVQTLLERVVMKMKYDYEESEVIQYVFGDMKTKFLTVFKEFFLADIGIYLADASKDQEVAERIDRAAELAVQGTNTPDMMMGLIEVFEGETAAEKKQVFERILKSLEEVRAENQKAMQEQAAAEAEKAEQDRLDDIALKREAFQNNLDVALIYKDGKSSDNLQNNATKERIKAAELDQKNRELKDKNVKQ